MLIFLVGFMGAGKTTLGKEMAAILGYGFVDTDELVEQQTGMPVNVFFEKEGEEAFRKAEAGVLRSLEGKKNLIIATGGGTPCYYNNMEWMNQNGVTVHVATSIPVLIERLRHQKNKRPLLKNLTDNELQPFINGLLMQRNPIYKCSKFQISGDAISAQTVINTVFLNCE